MIHARKDGAWARVLDRYVRGKVRAMFKAVWLDGELPAVGERGLIVYANHPGFWDGFVAHQVGAAAGWETYCMMAEENLARYPFLSRLGAFSVRRDDPRSVRETFDYARRLLAGRKAIVVFPEGELNPTATLRPLARGVEVLARRSGAACLALGLRYAFFEDERPEAIVSAGGVHGPEPLERLAERLSTLTRALHLRASTAGLRPLLRGRAGAAERWDAVRARLSP